MAEARGLGRGRFIAASLVLIGLQLAACSRMWGDWPVLLVFLGVVQLAKIPLSVGRLRALGRSVDDAVLGLVPLANLGLYRLLIGADPSETRRDKAIASWTGRTSALQAVLAGYRAVARSAVPVLVLSALSGLLYAALEFWMVEQVGGLKTMSLGTARNAADVCKLITAVLIFYSGLQYSRRKRVSRASWIPSVLLVPVLGLAVLLHFIGAGALQAGTLPDIALISVPVTLWALVYDTFVGAVLALVWVQLGLASVHGQGNTSLGVLIGGALSRARQVIGAHGAKVLAVTVGLQVVIPGIIYAVQYAFVDVAAALEPQHASLQRSSRLTRGGRRRIFKVFLLVYLLQIPAQLAITYFIAGPAAVSESVLLPTAMGFWPTVINTGLSTALSAVASVAFVHLYIERRREKEPEAAELTW